jgi:hypothetical protein
VKTPSRALSIGALVAAILTAVAVLAATRENWTMVVAAGMALLSGCFLVAVDCDRRVRALRRQVKSLAGQRRGHRGGKTVTGIVTGADVEASDALPPAYQEPVPVTAPDVVGAVRVLQAQYVGRLDRMQRSLERALGQLETRATSAEPALPARSTEANEQD